MKIALITDQHFGVRNDSVVFHDYMDRFYTEVFFPYLKKNKIDTIVDLGDTFDRRKYINYYSLSRAKKYWFDIIEAENLKLISLVGNHVIPYKNTLEINALDLLLNEYSSVSVINGPSEIDLDGTKLLLVPWICDNNYENTMKILNSTKAQVCLGHLELNGFQMYKGVDSHDGMDPKLFERFEHVFSGHYHHRSTKGNVTYLGCPYEMTWSDYGDEKGFHVFDTETRHLTFISNPIKMFHKIFYDDKDSSIENLLDVNFGKYKNTYVKIVVKAKNNPYWFDLFVDSLEKEGPANIQVVDDNLNLQLESDKDIIDEAEDTLTILRKYIDALEVTETEKPALEGLVRALYEEALTIE